ncbi:MAG: hypothetical protein JW801_09330 [Bacteroidales bacterium]|nr:hypothetical protein [Bacteroidales bacterium]
MKKHSFCFTLLVLMLLGVQHLQATDWTIDVVVAKDGTGDYSTINDALANNPNDGSNYVIYIKKGVYDEKLFISRSNITLLGEDRDSSIITQAILRRIYREDVEDTDWGVATINIGDNVTNLTLANLTVRNNFADLNPDVPENNDHTMTIRGGGDKVIIVNCNIIATGGDTLSLWNTGGGRFYHSGCYFEGYVDYVCPRGYCYISNSDFFGYNRNASIWHDGSGGKDHKLVVRNSYFDGVEFGLGRYHRMSAFYLLDCDFSGEMWNNGGINYVGDSLSNDRDKLVYGSRVYFDNCMRETGNYEWHNDNLETAEGSPANEEITDSWTFMDTWNPEASIYRLLEPAFLPRPGYHAKDVDTLPQLSWLPGKDAVSHRVYFGSSPEPEFVAEVVDTFYSLTSGLGSATRYYWRIDEVQSDGDTIPGKLWTFTTGVRTLASPAYNPQPAVGGDYNIYTLYLQWSANPIEVDTFYVYFGSQDNLELISKQVNADLYLYNMPTDTVYFWRVDIRNEYGITEGPTWYFNYLLKDDPDAVSTVRADNKLVTLFPNPTRGELRLSLKTNNYDKLSITFYDLYGKKIGFRQLERPSGDNNSWDLQLNDFTGAPLKKSLYYVNVNTGQALITLPLLIE